MKKNILLFILLFFSNTYYALIIESDQLSTVLDYIKSNNTLIIFDIDNTLAHPTQELGSDEWFCHEVETKMAEGFDYITSIYYALPKTFYAQFNIPLKATEQNIPELIEGLINKGIPVIALSTRSLFIAERTLDQLDDLNINFFIASISPHDLVLPMPHPCFYKCGILFGGNNDKGEALTCFLNTMNYYPEQIIFVDDKMKYLVSVERALEKLSIPFIGIRYSGCDQRVKNFDSKKSDAQWTILKKQNHYKIT